jgi:hypothetical protein
MARQVAFSGIAGRKWGILFLPLTYFSFPKPTPVIPAQAGIHWAAANTKALPALAPKETMQ